MPRVAEELSPQKGAFNKSVGARRPSMEIILSDGKIVTHLQSQVKWLAIIRGYFRKIKGKSEISKSTRRGAMMGQEGGSQPGDWVLASTLPCALWPQWNLASFSVLRFWNSRIPETPGHTIVLTTWNLRKFCPLQKSEDIYSLILMTASKDIKQVGQAITSTLVRKTTFYCTGSWRPH